MLHIGLPARPAPLASCPTCDPSGCLRDVRGRGPQPKHQLPHAPSGGPSAILPPTHLEEHLGDTGRTRRDCLQVGQQWQAGLGDSGKGGRRGQSLLLLCDGSDGVVVIGSRVGGRQHTDMLLMKKHAAPATATATRSGGGRSEEHRLPLPG